MAIELRDYQEAAVNKALWWLKSYSKPTRNFITAPTGSGKSILIASTAKELDNALIIQPSKEILEQNYEKLCLYGLSSDIGIYSASCGRKDIGRYTYATIGSICNNPDDFTHFDYVLIDELHLLANTKQTSGMFSRFFAKMPNVRVMGYSATPYRTEKKNFKEIDEQGREVDVRQSYLQMINRIPPFFFQKMVYKIEIQTLLDRGYLCPLNYLQADKYFDERKVSFNGGNVEYDIKQMSRYMEQAEQQQAVVNAVRYAIGQGRKNILVFCTSIEQAKTLQEQASAALGIACDSIDSKSTNLKERTDKINRFKTGATRVMFNVGILTTGFDYPELDCIVLARATMSLALLYQMVGRGMRPHALKADCLVIDLCKNITRLGRIESIRIEKEPEPNLPPERWYKDRVVTDVGVLSGKPLYTFKKLVEQKQTEERGLL